MARESLKSIQKNYLYFIFYVTLLHFCCNLFVVNRIWRNEEFREIIKFEHTLAHPGPQTHNVRNRHNMNGGPKQQGAIQASNAVRGCRGASSLTRWPPPPAPHPFISQKSDARRTYNCLMTRGGWSPFPRIPLHFFFWARDFWNWSVPLGGAVTLSLLHFLLENTKRPNCLWHLRRRSLSPSLTPHGGGEAGAPQTKTNQSLWNTSHPIPGKGGGWP